MRDVTLVGGLWWDGDRFRSEVVHIVGGLFTRRKPKVPTQTINISGGFVVPPLGDAHCHHFDNAGTVAGLVARYLKDGIFYAQNVGNSAANRRDPRVALRLNRPDSVDVKWADASLTSTLGHPFLVYESLALGLYTVGPFSADAMDKIRNSRKAEGDAYVFADTPEMLARVWPQYEKRRPDLLKVILSNSERHQGNFAKQVPGGHGLNPALLADVVRRAHQSGLRVWAHVDTAADFHLGVVCGIDGFAHLPGYGMGNQDARLFEIAEADAREAGKRGIFVNPTAAIARYYSSGPTVLERVQTMQKRNIKLLKKHGVPFTVGMDSYGTDAWPEAQYLSQLDVFTPLQLLTSWWETTLQAIFPGRRIGRLADGYEGSLLVTASNPLSRLENLRDIRLRIKQGTLLNV